MSAYKIMIVDDDPAVVTAITIRLQAEGFEVVNSVDAYQALENAIRDQPDLVILDVNMPAGGGGSVLERFRHISNLQTIPVILFTGDKSEKVQKMAREYGAYKLLYKPIDARILIQTIKEVLSEAPAA